MRIFAPNDVVAKSRYWYYLRQLKKVKKANGEIVALNVVRLVLHPLLTPLSCCDKESKLSCQIHEKKPLKVKNFAIWLRYDSRSGTHNVSLFPFASLIYKELITRRW